MTRRINITHHVIKRWRERVAEYGTYYDVEAFLTGASLSEHRRHWVPIEREGATEGTRYAYHHQFPGVCVVVQNRSAVTVVTRAMTAKGAA